jgi:TolB-like protein
MARSSNRLSQFWQELKRRKVLRSSAIYAGSAFIILEAATIIFPRWGLPDWTIDLVLYLLILGAFINIIVAWIFDITPEGVQKTKPVSEVRESDISTDSNAWKVVSYISLGVIVALIIFNVVPTNKELRPDTIESVVILPFENLTGDDGLDITLSGMHTMLIRDMQRIGGLRTICKTSAISYKNKAMSIHEITSELAVGAAIEPTVMCVGDSICMHVKVITPYPEESTIWMADYIVERSQLPNLWNRITKQITDELMIELSSEEESLLAESRIVDPEAYDAYLKGLSYLDKIDRDSLQKATEYFNIAVETEPNWAPPYAGLAEVWAYQMQMSFISPPVAIPKIYKNLNKALELNPNSSNSHYTKAVIAVWTEWNWEKGEEEFIKSLEGNPSNALCRMFYAHLLGILNRNDEAVYQANLALKLDPLRPFILGLCAGILGEGNEQITLQYLKKALSIDPNHRFATMNLGGAYRKIGDYEKWFEYWKKTTAARYGDKTVASVDSVFQEQGYIAAVKMTIKIDEEAVKERQINIDETVVNYMEIKEYDKAMDWLEKGYEIHHPSMPSIGGWWDQLKNNPRYIALLKKMNLPIN